MAEKQDTTDNPILEKIIGYMNERKSAPNTPTPSGEPPKAEEQVNQQHDTRFEVAVKNAAQELQRPTKSKNQFWDDHPFAGALLQGLIQSTSMMAPGRGPGPGGFGSGAPIARPYYGINQTGQGFPLNPQGRTYTFPSTYVNNSSNNFMMSIMNKFGRMLGMPSETEEVAGASRASLQGTGAVKDVAREEEAGKLQREQDYWGRLMTNSEEKKWQEQGIPPKRPVSEGFKKIIQEYRDQVGLKDKPKKTPSKAEKPVTERFAKPGEQPGWKADTREIVQPNTFPGLFEKPGQMSPIEEEMTKINAKPQLSNADVRRLGQLARRKIIEENYKMTKPTLEEAKKSEIEVPEWLGRLDQFAPGSLSEH